MSDLSGRFLFVHRLSINILVSLILILSARPSQGRAPCLCCPRRCCSSGWRWIWCHRHHFTASPLGSSITSTTTDAIARSKH